MSRGLGQIQRGILEALREQGWLSVFDLAVWVYFGGFSPWLVKERHLVAVRRALLSLQRGGRVRRGDRQRDGVIRWRIVKRMRGVHPIAAHNT
jgi:hypothetical protein